MTIHRARGLDGAGRASGAVVVVDTFRAFSTAAYLLDAGVAELIVTATIDEARALAARLPGALLCGEVGGARPEGFHLGNSPGEVVARGDLAGATVVLRTSGGTRCLLAAEAAGTGPVFAAALVVASATAGALRGLADVTIVAAGREGLVVADEDEVTADFLEGLIAGGATPPDLARIERGEPGARLRNAAWAHPDDIGLCLAVDRFRFAMRALPGDDGMRLVAVDD